jgi:hypothetical protein
MCANLSVACSLLISPVQTMEVIVGSLGPHLHPEPGMETCFWQKGLL